MNNNYLSSVSSSVPNQVNGAGIQSSKTGFQQPQAITGNGRPSNQQQPTTSDKQRPSHNENQQNATANSNTAQMAIASGANQKTTANGNALPPSNSSNTGPAKVGNGDTKPNVSADDDGMTMRIMVKKKGPKKVLVI